MIKARAMLIGIILILLSQSSVLAADERLAGDAFDKHASVMLLINSATGQILDANPAAMAFYGYK